MGLDWFGLALNVAGVIVLPTWPKVALVIYSAANIVLFVWAWRSKKSTAIAVSQIVFLLLNIRAFIIWR